MQLLDGKKTSEDIKQEIAAEVQKMKANGEKVPHLAAVLVGNNGASVVDNFDARSYSRLCAHRVQVGHHGDFNTATGAAQDFLLITGQDIEHAAADYADAHQADLKRWQITRFHDAIR